MAFVLLSKSKHSVVASSALVRRRKAAAGPRAVDFQPGFESPASLLHATSFPIAPVVQTKLTIGEPKDKYEQEADRVAKRVILMPNSEISGMSKFPAKYLICASGKWLCPKCADEERSPHKSLTSAITPQIQRQAVDIIEIEEAEEDVLQAKNIHGQSAEMLPEVENRLNTLRGGGQVLPWPIRSFFEPRFGCDFSRVRIHTGTQADQAARAVNAHAFTFGPHIVFRTGHYAPDQLAGRFLLAHELSHTIQQGVSSPGLKANIHAARRHYGTQKSTSVAHPLLATKPSMLQKADCNFFVYDSTESGLLGKAWAAGARACALVSWGGYSVASGNTIEIMLERILRKYDNKDCDCTEEIQFWSHGSPGNAMTIIKTREQLTTASFNIPGIDKYGHLSLWSISVGTSKLAQDARAWYRGLTRQQQLLLQLRDTICGPNAEVYYRSCEAFQGKTGQEFARASNRFWRSKVIGHTKIIGLTQPGKKVLRPGEEPYWSESEGDSGTEFKRDIYGEEKLKKPKKD